MKKKLKNRIISILLAVCCILLSGYVNISAYAATNNFTDISNHWARVFINYACNTKGVMRGYNKSTTIFAPNEPLTRAEFVMALGKMYGIDVNYWDDDPEFSDVSKNNDCYPYINWASKENITGGTSATTFSPDNPIRREDLAVLINKYAIQYNITLSKSITYPTFSDQNSIASYATTAVRNIVQAGIMSGRDDGTFSPKDSVTRAEGAAVFYNMYTRYFSKEAYSKKTVNITAGTTNSFYKVHTSTADIGNYIANAEKPFINRWNIDFNPSWVNLYGLPEDKCSHWNTLCDSSCGNTCANNDTTPNNHHKNWYYNFWYITKNMPYSGSAFRVVATCAANCYMDGSNKHSGNILGLGGSDLAFCKIDPARGPGNIRIYQHEISHLYSTDDGSCSKGVLCIMSGGFDNNTTYDLPNIWCPNCSNRFDRNAQ